MRKENFQKTVLITCVYIAIMSCILFAVSSVLDKTMKETLLEYWILIFAMYGVTIYSGLKRL